MALLPQTALATSTRNKKLLRTFPPLVIPHTPSPST